MTRPQDEWWPPPAAAPELHGDDVHVWRAALPVSAAACEALHDTLAPDERARADRYHFARDRTAFVVARGVLRQILGRYTGVAPAQLRFSCTEFGKPRLSGGQHAASLHFNVSHAGGLALYALARGRAVGIDVESIRADRAGAEVADECFSRDEIAALGALPPEQRTAAFFDCWTRKEAYVKALGTGLSHPLDRFTVSLAPDEPAALLRTDEPRGRARWAMVALAPGPEYAAALVVDGPIGALHRWHWSSPAVG